MYGANPNQPELSFTKDIAEVLMPLKIDVIFVTAGSNKFPLPLNDIELSSQVGPQ